MSDIPEALVEKALAAWNQQQILRTGSREDHMRAVLAAVWPDVPAARPVVDAEVKRLREALEGVRKLSALHFLGGAFDPEHMRSIANYCAGVLNGEEMPDDLDSAPEAYFIQALRENGWEVQRVQDAADVRRAVAAELKTAAEAAGPLYRYGLLDAVAIIEGRSLRNQRVSDG